MYVTDLYGPWMKGQRHYDRWADWMYKQQVLKQRQEEEGAAERRSLRNTDIMAAQLGLTRQPPEDKRRPDYVVDGKSYWKMPQQPKEQWEQLYPVEIGGNRIFPQRNKTTGKIIYDAFATGGGTPSLEPLKYAQSLRKEFNATPEAKAYSETRSRWMVMEKAWDEAQRTKNFVAVDQALITTFNKMTDPESVVRESEYARTASDLEAINRLKGKWQKIMSGGAGLTQDDREAIVRMGFNFMQAYEARYGKRLNEFRGYYQLAGLDPNKHLRPFASATLEMIKSPHLKAIIREETEEERNRNKKADELWRRYSR